MLNSKAKGEVSQGIIMAYLLKAGKIVLLPFGDNQRYDLVIDEDGTFVRVQCKTARLRDGTIRFDTSSSYAHRGHSRKGYKDTADLFLVYCPDNDTIYRIPVEVAPAIGMWMRVDPPKNNQVRNVRLARDFEFHP